MRPRAWLVAPTCLVLSHSEVGAQWPVPCTWLDLVPGVADLWLGCGTAVRAVASLQQALVSLVCQVGQTSRHVGAVTGGWA